MYNPNIYISVKPDLFAFMNVFMVNFISVCIFNNYKYTCKQTLLTQ